VSAESFIGSWHVSVSRHNIRGRGNRNHWLGSFALDQRLSFNYAIRTCTVPSVIPVLGLYRAHYRKSNFHRATSASIVRSNDSSTKSTRKSCRRYSYQRPDLSKILIPNSSLPQDQHVKLSTIYKQYIRDNARQSARRASRLYQTLNFGVNPTTFGSTSSFVRFLGNIVLSARQPLVDLGK